MPPSAQATHVDALLTDFSRRYRNQEYVGDQILPVRPVTRYSDKFARYKKESTFRIADTTTGFRSEAKHVSWETDTDTYSVVPHALTDYVTDREKANADPAYDLELDTTEYLTDQILLAREYEIATLLTTVGNWGTQYATLVGNDQWDSGHANATPVADIRAAISACVIRPNTMLVGQPVWDVLVEDATLMDKIKYSQTGILTEALIASVFGLDKVVIGKAMGYISGTLTNLWGDNVILAHVEPPRLKSIQLGLTFSMTSTHVVRKWPEPKVGGGSIQIEVDYDYQPKLVCTDVGYLIRDILA